jgi:hypothetical protein
MVIYYCFLLFF